MIPIRLNASITLKAAAGKPRRFSILAYSGGKLPVEGFPAPVVVDLTGLEIPGNVPILIDHTQSVEATLGITDTVTNDGKSLVMAGPVTGVSSLAKQVVTQADGGHTWQASIGTLVTDSVMVDEGQSVEVNGQVLTGPFVLARRSVLRETSVLPMGADSSTLVNLAARAAVFMKGAAALPTFEEWLAKQGLDASTLTPDALAALQLGYEAASATAPAAPAVATATAPAPAAVAPVAAAGAKLDMQAHHIAQFKQQLDKVAIETAQRHADLQRVAGRQPQILQAALAGGWSVDKAENEVLKAEISRTRPTSFNTAQNSAENLPKVLEAALCVTRKLNVEKQYTDQVLQAAHHQFRSGVGLKQILLKAAAANGMPLGAGDMLGPSNLREVMEYACPPRMLQASGGFSTLSLPGILGNVANKEIETGYFEEEQSWREVAKIKTVTDLKTVTSYRMLDDMEYEQLGPAGEIRHGTVSEESYTRRAKTYAKMYAITREHILNDDLGALDDIRARIGRGSAKKLNRVFWTRWLDNSTFFTTARGNYITGATTTLLTDMVGLQLALDAFDALRTPAADGSKVPGGLVGGSPTILLTPGGAIASKAEQIYKNSNLGSGTANADANIFSGRYRPVKSVFLNDSTITNYSATGWYLLRDPQSAAGVVVSFLNGQETPTVESSDADFNTLGIQMRGYHDFGCDQAEYLCGVKSKGAA